MKKFLSFLAMTMVLWSYSADTDFTEKFEKHSIYGKWIDIDKGKIIEINSKSSFSFEHLDNDLIIIKEGGKKSYLKRIGVAKTKISGRVVEDRGGRNFYAVKNADVFITNQNDSTIATRIKTDAKGFFSNESLPSGSYRLSTKKGKMSISVPITLTKKSEYLGTFVLKRKKEATFKSELITNGTYVISNKRSYKLSVLIRNYGAVKGKVCYAASIQDPDLRALNFKKGCRTIKAGHSVKVPLFVSFNPIKINSMQKVVKVTLTDTKGRFVVEPHPFRVYKNYFTLRLKTPLKSIKAYVVLPGQELKQVNIKRGKLALPKLSDQEYQLIIANNDPSKKTQYSVDIGAEQKLERGYKLSKNKKKGRRAAKSRRSKSKRNKHNPFKLKQSIGRYPDVGDIAIYTFVIPDTIVLNEDDPMVRVPFSKRNDLGDFIKYTLSVTNKSIAAISYKNGYLTIKPYPNANGVTTIILKDKKTYSKNNKKLFTLRIRPVNDKPVITSTPPTSAIEGKPYTYYLKAKDIETKYLKKEAVALPKWLKFDAKKGLLYGTPKSWDEGISKVSLRVKDHRAYVSQNFKIKVIALSRAPEAKNAFFDVKEDQTLKGVLKAKTRYSKLLKFTLVKKPKHGKVILLNNGKFTYTPKADFYGSDSFKFKASSKGKSTISTAFITVKSVNDAPKAEDIIVEEVQSGPVRLDWMSASHAVDVDEDKLQIKITAQPKLGNLRIADNELVYTPYANTKGDDGARLVISDGNGGEVSIDIRFYGVERHLTPLVLQTGQTTIYHAFDDAIYKKSLPRKYSFDYNETVVKDENSKLTWYVDDEPKKRTLKEAIRYCEALEVRGLHDWRLPTIEELVYISDKGRMAPAVDPKFKNTVSNYYWSSTPYAHRPGYQWVLYFDYGEDFYRQEQSKYYVRCVREGIDDLHPKILDINVTDANVSDANVTYFEDVNQTESNISIDVNNTMDANSSVPDINSSENNQTLESNITKVTAFERNDEKEIVWDKEAELMWYDGKALEKTPWVGAIKVCETLKFGGYDDWRLPNFNELYLITNHDGSFPAAVKGFKNINSGAYWTSTTSEHDHDRAWGISFFKGSDFTFDKDERLQIRCVRDQ